MTLLRPELRPVAIVVGARVLIPRLERRGGGDGLGSRLDRRLDVCLSVGDSAWVNGDGAGSTGVSGGGTAATGAVRFVLTPAATAGIGGRTGRRGRGGWGGASGWRCLAVRAT